MARKTHKHYAEEFGVSPNTFANWLKRGAPYQNEGKMKTWLLNLQRRPKGATAWLKDRGINVATKKRKPKDVKAATQHLKTSEDFRDYYRLKLSGATETNDTDSVKFWSELHLKTDESIRRSEMHSAKLGLDNGTTLPRAEVERILRAVFYAGNACVQGSLTSVSEHLTAIENPADLYHALKPIIVGGRLFAGFDKVKNTAGAPGLPAWVVDCVKLEAQQYLDSSESLWTKGKRK